MTILRGLKRSWSRARELAERTPETRNRYVDFLRAVSILVVVVGHWLMAAPFVQEGELSLRNDMLHVAPWTQWLTWVLQVMPLFFIVGGYANAISWEAAQRSGAGYGAWIAGRLQRLVRPTVPLLAAWTLLAVVAHRLGGSPELVRVGSQFALIPTWFLAVYVMVVVFAPGTHWLWRRFGMSSFWALALAAVIVDALGLAGGWSGVRWANYAFVWLAVHHLGYLWRDGRLAGPARSLPWALGGFTVLIFLVTVASYPVSMISVPGEEASNSRPPTIALLALGALHAGLVLALEDRARHWLRRLRPWAATVLVNGTIMTLYLWHVTVLVLVVGLAYWLGGSGLGLPPNGAAWWATRPLWIALLLAVLLPFVAVFGRFEERARAQADAPPPAWQSVAGALAVCGGLTALAIRVWIVLVTFVGAVLVAGVALPGRGRATSRG
jgi:hypothetical protein